MKRWKVDAGNSGTGPVGFVVYDILAPSAEAALAKVREALPEYIEERQLVNDDDDEKVTIVAYFNSAQLTLDNIQRDEEDEDDDDTENPA
jgi:hypothetical protein